MEIIKNLNDVSFTNKFIEEKERFYNLIHTNNNRRKTKNTNIKLSKEEKEYIENNNRLWFIFIMLHGIDEYNLLEKKTQLETKMRYNLIDKIKEDDNTLLLKANKIKVDEVINDFSVS